MLKTIDCRITRCSALLLLLLLGTVPATRAGKDIDPARASSLSSSDTMARQIASLQNELQEVKTELNHQKETQERVYDATVTRLSWEFNMIIGLIAVVTLLLGFFGIRIVRRTISNSVEQSISKLSEERISQELEDIIKKRLEHWDEKCAEKYKELSDLVEIQKKRVRDGRDS